MISAGSESRTLLDVYDMDEYFPETGEGEEGGNDEYDDGEYEDGERISSLCAVNIEERNEQRKKAKSFSKFEKGNLPTIYNDIKFWMPKFLENPDGTRLDIKNISLKMPGPGKRVAGLHVGEKISWWNFVSEIVMWCFPKINHNPIVYGNIVIEEVIKPLYYCTDAAQAEEEIRFKRLRNRMVMKLKQ